MKLLFIRHGRSEGGDPYARPARPVQGSLSEDAGLPQARALAAALRGQRVDAALSSPYGRALQTAEAALAGRDVPILVRDYLREWEPAPALRGADAAAIAVLTARDRDRFAEACWKTELGEGCFDLCARLVPPFLADLDAFGLHARMGGFTVDAGFEERVVAVFAHAGSLAVLLAHVLGLPPFPLVRFEFQETGMAEVRFTERRGIWYPVLTLPPPAAAAQRGWS